MVQSCDVGGAVTVPGQGRESGVNFSSSVWRGLFVCVSSVVWCAGGGSMVCENDENYDVNLDPVSPTSLLAGS